MLDGVFGDLEEARKVDPASCDGGGDDDVETRLVDLSYLIR